MDVAADLLANLDPDMEIRTAKQLVFAMKCLESDTQMSTHKHPYFQYVVDAHDDALLAKNTTHLTYLWLMHLWGNTKYRKGIIDSSPDTCRLGRFMAVLDVAMPAYISAYNGGVSHNYLGDPTLRLADTEIPVYDSAWAFVCAMRLFFVMS
jgi:hypothetical protein